MNVPKDAFIPPVFEDVTEAIGNTPLVRLRKMPDPKGARVYAKMEMLNPGGSVKDRIGASMLNAAEEQGLLRPGGTVVECTSGNTGMGLALSCAVRGYRLICTMPDKMSTEKISLLRAMGAEVIVTPSNVAPDHPESYYSIARSIAESTDNCVWTNQYFNDANPRAHYESTGPELWAQTEGKISAFVAGMGTCGTISGTGRYLKEQNPQIRIIGVDPEGSILKYWFDTGETGEAQPYKVEGIGEDIVPSVFYRDAVDEVRSVNDETSFLITRRLVKEEGIFAGGSCGSAVAIALDVAREMNPDQSVVVLLPDSGAKYVSKIFNDDWMRENRFLSPTSATASDVLHRGGKPLKTLLTVESNATVREAINLMRQNEVSQLPVMKDGEPVGRVTDSRLMAAVLDDPSCMDQGLGKLQEPPLLRVEGARRMSEILATLSGKDAAVLVEEHGHVAGIITRYDLIDFVQEGH